MNFVLKMIKLAQDKDDRVAGWMEEKQQKAKVEVDLAAEQAKAIEEQHVAEAKKLEATKRNDAAAAAKADAAAALEKRAAWLVSQTAAVATAKKEKEVSNNDEFYHSKRDIVFQKRGFLI